MISIVDYGLGNVHAIANIYKRLNIDVCIAGKPDDLLFAERIILPGVGAFDWAVRRLSESGMKDVLEDMVIAKGVPVLGICVGMQMMTEKSEEGKLKGLGWIGGEVRKFNWANCPHRAHLPHMGWNDVQPVSDSGLFRGLGVNSRFYFLHSYFFAPYNHDHIYAVTDYNGSFASSVHSENIYGVQFHPEKSHQWGIKLLKNFSEIQACCVQE